MSTEAPEHTWRRMLGLHPPGEEGHVVFDRDNAHMTIKNADRVVWEGNLCIPAADNRNHASLVKMFTDAGFKSQDFRRGFAQHFFGRIPLKPCTTKCTCSDRMRKEFSSDLPGETCIWKHVREYENFWKTFYMKPDAWLVLKEHKTLVVVEVDVTHHHDARRYRNVWWWLDSEGWNLCVIHVDRHANACSPHDFAHYWYEDLLRQADNVVCS